MNGAGKALILMVSIENCVVITLKQLAVPYGVVIVPQPSALVILYPRFLYVNGINELVGVVKLNVVESLSK